MVAAPGAGPGQHRHRHPGRAHRPGAVAAPRRDADLRAAAADRRRRLRRRHDHGGAADRRPALHPRQLSRAERAVDEPARLLPHPLRLDPLRRRRRAGGDGRRLELGAGAGAVRHRHLGAGRGHAAGAQCVPVAAGRHRDQRAGPGAGVVLARPVRQPRAADVFRQRLDRPRHRGLARGGLDAAAAAGRALSLDLLEDPVARAQPASARDRRRRLPPVPRVPRARPASRASSPAGSWSGSWRSCARCRCWARGCWRPRRSSRRISTPSCRASSRCSSASSSS